MPTILGKPYATTWRGSPPHMLTPDIPVWYRFLQKWGDFFTNLYYDVLLGGPYLTPEQERDPYWRMWRANTSKRADAIAELDDQVWIIEVSQRPGLRAVGQLMVYLSLWIEDPKILKPEKAILVCEEIDTDLIASAARYGIFTYPTPLT
jgi:hypothetical protein